MNPFEEAKEKVNRIWTEALLWPKFDEYIGAIKAAYAADPRLLVDDLATVYERVSGLTSPTAERDEPIDVDYHNREIERLRGELRALGNKENQ